MHKRNARIAGGLYAVTIVARIFADGFVRDRYIIPTDPAATIANILAHGEAFRWGFVADIVAFASMLALTVYLYDVFRSSHRNLALVALLCSVVSCVSQAMSSVFHVVGTSIASGPAFTAAYTSAQLQGLVLLMFRIRSVAYHQVGLVFLGFYLLLLGWLVFRSKLMPRFIAVCLLAAGAAYMPFLWPPLASSLLPNLLIPVGVGQVLFTIWLLIFGVRENTERNQETGR